MLKDVSFVKALTNVQVAVAKASVASNKPKIELESYSDTFIVGNSFLVIHDHNRPVNVNVFSYNPKDGYRCARTVDTVLCYDDPHNGQKLLTVIMKGIKNLALIKK